MAEHVLNLLPLDGVGQADFRAAAPEAEHIFAPALPYFSPARRPEPEELRRATVILGSPRAADLALAGQLRWLQTWSSGVDEYLKQGVLPDGAMLTSAAGAYDLAVAEHMLSMTLALLHKLHLYRDNQSQSRWRAMGRVKSICGSTVLVVGAGRIGTTFAGMCKALGARTIGLRRTVGAVPRGLNGLYPMEELDGLLPQADVTALVLPHAPETVHIMDARRLSMMKDGAVLINAGRGTAVDPDALLDNLRSGHLRAAGLDVTEPEPLPEDHPLWREPNALITPHVAGGFYLPGTLDRVTAIALDNLRRYVSGQELNNRKR